MPQQPLRCEDFDEIANEEIAVFFLKEMPGIEEDGEFPKKCQELKRERVP